MLRKEHDVVSKRTISLRHMLGSYRAPALGRRGAILVLPVFLFYAPDLACAVRLLPAGVLDYEGLEGTVEGDVRQLRGPRSE